MNVDQKSNLSDRAVQGMLFHYQSYLDLFEEFDLPVNGNVRAFYSAVLSPDQLQEIERVYKHIEMYGFRVSDCNMTKTGKDESHSV